MKSYVLRLKKDDEVVKKIIDFCNKGSITSAWFSGLGAASSANLSIYDLAKKEYILREFSGKLEILSLCGNVGTLDGKLTVHSHATFSDETFIAFGGHVNNIIVAATCEIILHQIDTKLTRKFDEGIGLNLLEL